MKYLIALMASLLFVSCQNKTQEENKESIIRVVETETPTEERKVIKVGEISDFNGTYDISQDSDVENESIKSLKFGIYNNQYKKNEKKVLSQFKNNEAYGYHIGDFGFYNLTPYFVNDELYRIDINGFNKMDYDKVLDEIEVVKNIFSNKYGSPIYETAPPRDKELSANEGICIAEWKAGNKVMQLCFFDFTKAAHSNLLRIVIFRSDMLQSKQEADKQKKEEHAKANTDLI